MDSLTYKQIVGEFQDGLQDLTEDLDAAVHGKFNPERVRGTVTAARQKLVDFETLLGRFDGDEGKRESFETRFAESLDEIRDALTRLA